MREPTELTGPWRAAPADDELHREFADPAFDDAGWEPIAVPGHWRSNPAFATTDGPVLYRTTFEQSPGADDRRWWVSLDGMFYQGDVFLDGAYLGDTEGYFVPHSFEVTDHVRGRSEHTLAIEVGCARQRDLTAKRNITGVFQHWDCFDSAWNPGGIWRPVHLVETGPVRIARLNARCIEASDERAVMQFSADLDAVDGRDVDVRTVIGGLEHVENHPLASGDNTVEWRVTVDRPRLWWPRALSPDHQPAQLYDVEIEIRTADDAGQAEGAGEAEGAGPTAGEKRARTVSDRRRFRTGLRSVRMRNWQLSVNGERLFLKGANQGPTRMALGEATAAECRRDVELACEAGLDFLRLHAHVAAPETYAAADEAGLLLWQDFPLQWGYARQIRKQAIRQARAMVDRLAHHPSVAIWCGHNEPFGLDVEPGALEDPRNLRSVGRRSLVQQQVPTWNKSVLDRSVKRAIDKADGSRPVIAHSGVLPHLPSLDGTDSHLYFGWYWGDERELPAAAKLVPRLFRFVSEFGAQAVPPTDDFIDPSRWPDLDWDRLTAHHGLQRRLLDRHVPIDGSTTYEAWREATQQYQATVIKHHIETLRRLKYRPTGGFAQFCFADGHPSISWSVLDHERRPKAGHQALVDACRPVIVVADRLPAVVTPGDPLALELHVVSDRRHRHTGTIVARLEWKGGSHQWQFAGDVPADSCVRVGTIQFDVPDAPGPLLLSLSGTVGGDPVDNTYAADIGPAT